MAGYADMGHDEMVARIAVLEAFVLKLVEAEARRREATEGKAGVERLLHSLGEASALRRSLMKDDQAQIIARHTEAMVLALETMLEPDLLARN